jgi:hypothetical protein
MVIAGGISLPLSDSSILEAAVKKMIKNREKLQSQIVKKSAKQVVESNKISNSKSSSAIHAVASEDDSDDDSDSDNEKEQAMKKRKRRRGKA